MFSKITSTVVLAAIVAACGQYQPETPLPLTVTKDQVVIQGDGTAEDTPNYRALAQSIAAGECRAQNSDPSFMAAPLNKARLGSGRVIYRYTCRKG